MTRDFPNALLGYKPKEKGKRGVGGVAKLREEDGKDEGD